MGLVNYYKEYLRWIYFNAIDFLNWADALPHWYKVVFGFMLACITLPIALSLSESTYKQRNVILKFIRQILIIIIATAIFLVIARIIKQ